MAGRVRFGKLGEPVLPPHIRHLRRPFCG